MFSQALVHQGSLAASENVSRTLPEDYAQQERVDEIKVGSCFLA